jgi:hypothetical protein
LSSPANICMRQQRKGTPLGQPIDQPQKNAAVTEHLRL